jgi:hypothetical protein
MQHHTAVRRGGVWVQRGGRPARRGWQRPGCGACGWRTTSAKIGEGGGGPVGPCYSSGQRQFDYILNSNEFKLLQNGSNFE